ncbi:NAD-dependent succinate-semialdehyde dehydrogenase [Parahaliea maris]|uniref:NAD-dependent succinate-semialdehyde dehydrogenase n=2 Tax=Parahaliea maris TaxID=2716870 RepID=A0A5C8ZUL8_9GAMM|nr:NAD-dependent succinate-semialdehyde dehydrogenase [Parahaliea maris]
MTESQVSVEMLDVRLLINGEWVSGSEGNRLTIIDPATNSPCGHVAVASERDLANAVAAAEEGFNAWRNIPPFQRATILGKAATLLRERAGDIAADLSAEQGKPFAQAKHEVSGAADVIEWFAEEGKRCFGQVIPGRTTDTHTLTRLEPIGPVAAFTPWNFPVSQAVKKVAAALAAGCSIILKGPEEAPGACAGMMKCFADAGLPSGSVGLLYGNPAEISNYLVAHDSIRCVTLTGSVAVGKTVASLAGRYMKPVVMELGGHAPVIVCEDADLDLAVEQLVKMKFLNAGQVCLSPTRFLVARKIYDDFVSRFRERAVALKIDAGDNPEADMGPLASQRRIESMEALVADAIEVGATLKCGGQRLERTGCFFMPTVLSNVPTEARAMNEEPFGPVALIRPFDTVEEALVEANRLPFGLASYIFTNSIQTEAFLTENIQAGMVAVNRIFSSNIEAPFSGVKDSGYGTEGGTFAIRNFLTEKMITRFVG